MKFGIPEKDLKEIIYEIKSHLGDTKSPKLFIYGSRVKGNHREFSDIDLLLKAESLDRAALEKIDFSELDTAFKVDFVLDPDLFQKYKEEIYSHMVELGLE